jgi:dolichol-phosphate mannosyltransferase
MGSSLNSELPPLFVGLSGLAMVLLVVQMPMTAILLSRLLLGPFRRPPLLPQPSRVEHLGTVSIVIPTLNEAHRLEPCLTGVTHQGYEVREILVVDSRSTDGTQELVNVYQAIDPRIRLITDDPLPAGWVGRPWALNYGFYHSSIQSKWILGIDADTYPKTGLVAALVAAMEAENYDLVSLAPQFILKSAGEFWLQPALLMTLIYRFGPVGSPVSHSQRVMANGQCFMIKRDWLTQLKGYETASTSFCDDVTLARNAAQQGARVGFWDGSQLLGVRMYEGIQETWKEWGRSLDLKDAAPMAQIWWDAAFLLGVQSLPWLLVTGFWLVALLNSQPVWPWPIVLLLVVNGGLMLMRLAMQVAIAPVYDWQSSDGKWAFWLAPLADGAAVLRIVLSSLRTPTEWRGRHYDAQPGSYRGG